MRPPAPRLAYKWIALTNTTIAMLMSSINQTIVMIGMPAIFSGLHVNPLAPGGSSLLLWLMMGNAAVTTMLLVSFGRLADMLGRVRLYRIGVAIVTVGSLLCALTPSAGTTGALELIAFRVLQAVGGAMVISNTVAILADAFPAHQRGFSLGINQIAFIGGNVVGVVIGGLLATVNWRLDFLVSVPVGIAASVWAFLALREIGVREKQPPDWLGNITFALGLFALMYALTEALTPYGGQGMGWTNPLVAALLVAGLLLLALFVVIEQRVRYPMFDLSLFRIRGFLFGCVAAFLFSVARGGLMFMLVVWLQGVWLPLHGVAYADAPLQAGLDTMPMMIGFVLAGPLGGWLSDRYGARVLSTSGILVAAVAAALMMRLPADFALSQFAALLFLMGVGLGLFSSPNTSQVMGVLPPSQRGAGAGMRTTMLTAGMTASQALFFTIVITSLSHNLGPQVGAGAAAAGLPAVVTGILSRIPAGAAILAAMLGYDPVTHLLPASVLASLPPDVAAHVSDPRFFSGLLAQPFVGGIRAALAVTVVICVGAALASVARGSGTSATEAEVKAYEPPAEPRAARAAGPAISSHAGARAVRP